MEPDVNVLEKEIEAPVIDTAEGVQEYVNATTKTLNEFRTEILSRDAAIAKKDTVIEGLEKEVKDIGDLIIISKDKWKETDSERKKDYDFGVWTGAIQKRDYRTLAAQKTMISITTKGQDDKVIRIEDAKKGTLKNLSAEGEKADVGNRLNDGGFVKEDLGTPLTGDASGTDAQYLVPQTIYETAILKTLEERSEIIPRFTRKTMAGRLLRYPTEGTKFLFTYVTNEVTDKTEQNPTWSYKDLECETFAGWVGVTDEFMEDTYADIGGELRAQAIDALQLSVETQLIDGSGSPFTGILQDTGTTSLAMASTSFDDVEWSDVLALRAKLTTKGKRRGGVYMMHPTIWDILSQSRDPSGRFLYLPHAAAPKTIGGYPVLTSDNMPEADDTSAATGFIAFGNPSYTYYGIRMGLEFKYFTETFYAVQDDENFFRIRTRYAGIVAIPANYAILRTAAS